MDLLVRKYKAHLLQKYLGAAFGSAMLASVYSLVDMAMVGQYQGRTRSGAGVVAPVWNIIYSLGLLTGIGGSVLSSTHRGAGEAPAGQPGLYCGAGLYGASGGGQLAGPNLL